MAVERYFRLRAGRGTVIIPGHGKVRAETRLYGGQWGAYPELLEEVCDGVEDVPAAAPPVAPPALPADAYADGETPDHLLPDLTGVKDGEIVRSLRVVPEEESLEESIERQGQAVEIEWDEEDEALATADGLSPAVETVLEAEPAEEPPFPAAETKPSRSARRASRRAAKKE